MTTIHEPEDPTTRAIRRSSIRDQGDVRHVTKGGSGELNRVRREHRLGHGERRASPAA